MKKIEVSGLGVFVEVYKRKDSLTDIEMLKEAVKTLQREVLRVQSNSSNGIPRPINNNEL